MIPVTIDQSLILVLSVRFWKESLRANFELINKSPNNGPLQSAYRVFHSTETAMIRVVSDLLTKVDTGSASVLLSLDISAAFDSLDHS